MCILALVALTMVAFAANSVLTRMALAPELIDAMRFGSLRILSGAATLWAILALRGGLTRPPPRAGAMTTALIVYLIGFSFAYERLDMVTSLIWRLTLYGDVRNVKVATRIDAFRKRPIDLERFP